MMRLGTLVDSFNELTARLDKSFKTQTRFVQDASHELKTPLTIIQTNLDTVLEDKDSSKEEYKEAAENALNGIKRLNKLTADLLELTLPSSTSYKKVDVVKLLHQQTKILKSICKTK